MRTLSKKYKVKIHSSDVIVKDYLLSDSGQAPLWDIKWCVALYKLAEADQFSPTVEVTV